MQRVQCRIGVSEAMELEGGEGPPSGGQGGSAQGREAATVQTSAFTLELDFCPFCVWC